MVDGTLVVARTSRVLRRPLLCAVAEARFLDRLVEQLERQETARLRLEATLDDVVQRATDTQRQVAQVGGDAP